MNENTTSPKGQLPWMIVIPGCIIALLAFGPRSAMGFFQIPIIETNGWDRTTFGLAIAIQNICWGIGQPIFGAISDKYGTGRVLVLGGIFYALGLYGMSIADTPFLLHFTAGILVGLGTAAGSFAIIMSAFARNVPDEKRMMVFGIGTAAGSAGMALFSPLSVAMIDALGWQQALIWMAASMLIIPLLAWNLRGSAKSGTYSKLEDDQTVSEAIKEAFGHQSFNLLTAGFFVCGFHVAFITAHFPAYISDIGLEAKWAGWALMLIGGFNIVGSLASGILGQRYPKPKFLTLIYVLRSFAIICLLLLPQTPTMIIIFACAMGLLWLSTVPPTNALVAVMFGTKHLGLLGGIVFFSHQVGSFLGVWLGGYLYDIYGSFDIVWWLGVVLGLVAAILHWPIKEAPVDRHAQTSIQ
ncbi:MAG: MFS transporter [Rhizobiaceae bacterium]